MGERLASRLGCFSFVLGAATLVVVVVLALLFYPYADDPLSPTDLPRGAIPLYVDLTPQATSDSATAPVPLPTFEPPTTAKIIRLTDAQLSTLLRQHAPASRITVRSQLGRLLVRGGGTDSIQADAWLAAERGRLRLRLQSLVWQGYTVPRPLLGFIADQVNSELEGLFPEVDVAAVDARVGEMEVIVRPLEQDKSL